MKKNKKVVLEIEDVSAFMERTQNNKPPKETSALIENNLQENNAERVGEEIFTVPEDRVSISTPDRENLNQTFVAQPIEQTESVSIEMEPIKAMPKEKKKQPTFGIEKTLEARFQSRTAPINVHIDTDTKIQLSMVKTFSSIDVKSFIYFSIINELKRQFPDGVISSETVQNLKKEFSDLFGVKK